VALYMDIHSIVVGTTLQMPHKAERRHDVRYLRHWQPTSARGRDDLYTGPTRGRGTARAAPR
jgi:hypothetical protein